MAFALLLLLAGPVGFDGRYLISIVDDDSFDEQPDIAEELIRMIRRERALSGR